MKNKLNIVLDTNILLVSIFETSPYYWVLDFLDKGKYNLLISNEILTEYDEIISKKLNPSISHKTISYLLSLNNVFLTTVYYHWNLLRTDKSDNKFVDCAVANNADFIITHDNHFNLLKEIHFPKVQILDIIDFQNLFKTID